MEGEDERFLGLRMPLRYISSPQAWLLLRDDDLASTCVLYFLLFSFLILFSTIPFRFKLLSTLSRRRRER